MNREFEVKYSVDNYAVMKQKLIAMGAQVSGDVSKEDDLYFKVPQKKGKTKYLRIRVKNDSSDCLLAYHEVVDELETKEWEVKTLDANITGEILKLLNFPIEIRVIKRREIFRLANVEIVLDQVDGLGNFIEIEAPNKSVLNRYVSKLNLLKNDIVSGMGYPDLLRTKNNSRPT